MAVDVRRDRPIVPAATEEWRLGHLFPADSRINERGHLELGGCDLVEVVREFGTPCYVFAEQDLRLRAQEYLASFRRCADNFEVLFASKALPATAAYQLFSQEGLSVDVASGGELFMALEAGVAPERIYFHGNNKTDNEIEEAIVAGVGHFVIDSFDEIDRLKAKARKPQRVLVRVTPGVDVHTHAAARTGQNDSKFGFSLLGGEAARAIEAVEGAVELELVGLHAHIGSQIFDLHEFEQEIEALATLFTANLKVLNIGGGLGISYLPDERPPSIARYVETLVHRIEDLFDPMPRILVEPGRSLVGRAGVTAYTVGTIKRVPGARTYVAVDGGMSDNLRPMLYGSKYCAVFADRPEAEAPATESLDVVGKHCETGDNLIRQAQLSSPKLGDILVMPATGAYGHSMANNYNGVPRPPVIFCSNGDARVVVRRERYQDLLSRDCSI